jgi:serine/threonine-protein kinase RsbW
VKAPAFHRGLPPPPDAVWLERSWPSRLDRKTEVIDTVADLLRARGQVLDEDQHWLLLALDEAVTNAMLHGNEGDHTVEIRVLVGRRGPYWTVQIDDHGEGFTPEQIPDCENPDNLLLEHGRGVRLMLEWLDELAYYRGGATIAFARHGAADHHAQ